MTGERDSSRKAFADNLAAAVSSGTKTLLLATLGAGKSHALAQIRETLRDRSVPSVFVDLFTAASTPERLLLALAQGVSPFMKAEADGIKELVESGSQNRHQSSAALLRLFDLLATRKPSEPFVWLIDEATEIRSLAYFPELSTVEKPFAEAVRASRGAILSSSYLGLARDLFPDFDQTDLPGLTSFDLADVPSLRSDGDAIAAAIRATSGSAATLLPLVADMRDSRDVTRSLVRLLMPGGSLELVCRGHYEILLLRSRGYAVSKRAAEVVAQSPDRRLTDLFPLIGRTAGASRQYLRWLVEVGLLTQTKKRYRFAAPIVGLWAGLYIGRAEPPTEDEVTGGVREFLAGAKAPVTVDRPPDHSEPPTRRPDRFEEID